MNPMDMIKIAGMWSAFKQRHPKLPMFSEKRLRQALLDRKRCWNLLLRHRMAARWLPT